MPDGTDPTGKNRSDLKKATPFGVPTHICPRASSKRECALSGNPLSVISRTVAPRVGAPSCGESADQGAIAPASQASIAINRDLSFIPSVQPIRRAQPMTAIPRGENGETPSAGETLLDRNRGDGEDAKPVQAIQGRHPNIAFTILEER